MSSPTVKALVEVRSSLIHGQGVHALRRLARGTRLGIYEGRRYTAEALREVDWDARHGGMTYLFELSDGTTIDGAEGGNALRFLNHACQPNCEAVEMREVTGHLILQLVVVEDVTAGSELFLDYGLVIDKQASPDDYSCCCGQPACRGTMVAAAA